MSKKNHLYPEALPEGLTLQEVNVSKQLGLEKEIISKFVFYKGEQWWQARMPPSDKYPEYPMGRVYFTRNHKDPKILNYAVDEVNGKARGNLKWNDGNGGNPSGRPAGAKNKITVKSVCDNMGANPVELLVAAMTSDIGALRRYGVKNPKDITLAQKLSVARYLTDKLVPNIKPVEIGEDGEWNPNKVEGTEEERRNQLQVYIPSVKSSVKVSATESEIEEIERDGVEKFLEKHPEAIDDSMNSDETALVWEVEDGQNE